MKKAGKIMLVIALSFIGVLLLGLLIILANSPGKLPPLKDEQGKIIQGSISEKVWLEVGGIKQGMFIRGENPQSPVILYLHGGPGNPLLQFITYLEKSERLEKYFTVCYWDQRGAGMTYSKSTDPLTMTVEQMVEDTREVTEYLKLRFGQNKIYLLGHSWGSYLGIKTIEKYPENYLSYIGMGLTANFVESERLSYDYMLNHAKDINDKDVIEKLEKFDPHTEDFPLIPEEGHQLDYLMVRTETLEKYGIGRLHQGVSFQEILRTFLVFKGYTLSEKINWFLGSDFSMIHLFPALQKVDLFVSSVKFEVPFYIIQGIYDYMTSYTLAKEYFDVLEAPKKEFFTFFNSAHSPNMEEPEEFIKVLYKIALENPQETIGNLIDKQGISFISSVDEHGFPNTKAMLPPVKREGIKIFYWHTNSPSMRIKHYRNNPKACIYFCDKRFFRGVMLRGTMEVLDNKKIKKELWKDDFNVYYEGGMDGGDFIILKFTAETGRYYSNYGSEDFKID
ncbi:MAG: alpha/beta fold hydrolase [Treponema sp.]|nr:alpha/beta fold hydrolase [Treponema sp.]